MLFAVGLTVLVGSWARGWRAVAASALAPVFLTAASQLAPGNTYAVTNDLAYFALVMIGAPILAGRVMADRRRITASLAAEHRRSVARRDLAAAAASAEERLRLAAGLDAAVSARLAQIIGQAAELPVAAGSDPQRELAQLSAIERSARATLEDIRHLLGTLRRDEEPEARHATPPQASSRPRTVRRFGRAGSSAPPLRWVLQSRPQAPSPPSSS